MFSSNFHIRAFLNADLTVVHRTDGFTRTAALQIVKIKQIYNKIYNFMYNLA